ncbi:MAG: UvrD-helicase domain-containing protein [Breznakibacter sp.]
MKEKAMSLLKIYSASAGSGKTFTLAGDFISLLINDPSNYSAILAVTFTNKATAEMKTRIIENLYLLATETNELNEKDQKKQADLLAYHIQETGKSERQIRVACRLALNSYLNDFSKFNVSTIDSFFQKVIRSFAYEAGLPAAFNIEVDQKVILRDAIDTLLMEIGLPGNEELKRWILEFTQNKMEEGTGWSITGSLTRLGNEVFRENLQSIDQEYENILLDKPALRQYQKELTQIIKQYESTLEDFHKKIAQELVDQNIKADHLAGKSRSPLVTAFKNKDFFTQSKNLSKIRDLLEMAEEPQSACHNSLKDGDKNDLIARLQQGILPTIKELGAFVTNNFRDYFTAREITHNFYSLGITIDIRNKIAQLAHEQNLFLISDTNRLLNQIIDHNEAPFIYEKSGTRYRNIMIDEFQDTSRLQWNNFRPLIINSLSQNDSCMIVGDVKQSIYRWRNSDWQLLNQTIYDDLAGYDYQRRSLQINWRSKPNIIHFNNLLFEKASSLLKEQMESITADFLDNPESAESIAGQITRAYSDTIQDVSPRPFDDKGYVLVEFLEKEKKSTEEEEEEQTPLALQRMDEAIDQLVGNNFRYRDICILVRNNKEGSLIASHLLSGENPRPVISNDSLLLGNSVAVKMVMGYLRFINDTSDKVALAQIKLMHALYENEPGDETTGIMDDFLKRWEQDDNFTQSIIKLKGLPFLELAEAIVDRLPQWMVVHQVVFINGLMENIRTFAANKTVNIHEFLEWWDDKGSTTSIAIPEDQDAIRIMTIHKSKGLQFKAVLIPFANWEIDMKPGDKSIIWCSPTQAPFNRINPIPVQYNTALSYTHLFDCFYEEKLYRYVDNLNLLYVALTRAEEVLMIWCEKSAKIDGIKKISDLMLVTTGMLPTDAATSPLDGAKRDEQNQRFEVGTMPCLPALDESEKKTNPEPRYFKKNPFSDKLRIFPESETISHITGKHKIWQGKLMHRIMEQIKTVEDIDAVLHNCRHAGLITETEQAELQQLIIQTTALRPEWFDGSHTIYAETSILSTSETYRPDRVMVLEGKAIVVDYKFGEKHSPEHEQQVLRYQRLLHQMGYQQTEAFLWYFNEKEGLIRVTDNPVQGKLF